MLQKIKRWYEGESKLEEFENDRNSHVFIMPHLYTEYHWTAKIARRLVSFYLEHWKWIWSAALALLAYLKK